MRLLENHDAQFMLLAGFIIAISLVITTVMLSSVIFEFNSAMGAGNELLKDETVNLMLIMKDETRNAYINVTNSTGSVDQQKNNFSSQTRNFSANLQKIYASHGQGVNISWDVSKWNGIPNANFTDDGIASGLGNWTVMESVLNSTIVINITSMTSPFNINITNATKTWQINFTTPGNRTINNSQINANITSAYSISFINGSYVAGNYSINGSTTYGKNFIRARDYVFNSTVTLFTSKTRINVTIPVSVPW